MNRRSTSFRAATRALVRAAVTIVLVSFAPLGLARPVAGSKAADVSSVLGTWTGSSLCVGDRPACKNEEVVYRLLPVEGQPLVVTVLADKIIDGKRVPMGGLQFQYNESERLLTCEFTRNTTHGLFSFAVTGDTMTGTLVILPDKALARRISVHRVRGDQVPPAPALDEYACVSDRPTIPAAVEV